MCTGFEQISGEGNGLIIESDKAAFYRKAVIYKNERQIRKDKGRSWPAGSFCTPTSAVKAIIPYLKASSKPICLFIGQPLSIDKNDEEHCTVLVVWKEEKAYKMLVKDSRLLCDKSHPAGVTSFSKLIAQGLGCKNILLKEADGNDNNSELDCVMRAFHFIADVLDGVWNSEIKDVLPIYNVISKRYARN